MKAYKLVAITALIGYALIAIVGYIGSHNLLSTAVGVGLDVLPGWHTIKRIVGLMLIVWVLRSVISGAVTKGINDAK